MQQKRATRAGRPTQPADADQAGRASDAVLAQAVAAARVARAQAYAPYSQFAVGAALVDDAGAVFVGCNVENAAYPSSICAERGAVMAAVAAGSRRFSFIVIVTDADVPTPPCGSCRQVLAEFGLDLLVISVGAKDESRWRLRDLLPDAFGPSQLRSATSHGQPEQRGP
jgi:cytidine deaminase